MWMIEVLLCFLLAPSLAYAFSREHRLWWAAGGGIVTLMALSVGGLAVGIVAAIIVCLWAALSAPRTAPPAANVADQIAKLADLRDRGVITEDEFNKQKRRMLA
jgi:hypothetical protein